jgi:hypothetical protein
MAKRNWEIDIDGTKHKIELMHGYVTGKIEIFVDGRKMEIPKSELPKLLEFNSKHKLNIAGHPGQINIDYDGSGYAYQLLVEGQPILKGADETRQEQATAQAEFNELKGILSAPLLFLLGAGAFWYNWNTAHTTGFVSRGIALISPLPIIFALYLLLFPRDLSQFSTGAVIRVVIVMILAMTLGAANFYALMNGIY